MKRRTESTTYVTILSFFLLAGIFLTDIFSPSGLATGVLYIGILVFASWSKKVRILYFIAIFTSFFVVIGLFISWGSADNLLEIINRAIIILFIWFLTVFLSRRIETERGLIESEQRYALATRGANDGLWIWKLTDNKFYFTSRWKEIIGWTEDEIGDDPEEWFNRVHKEDRGKVRKNLHRQINRETDFFRNEHRILHKDGTYKWVLARGLGTWDEQGAAIRLAGSFSDITVRKQKEEQLRMMAVHDPLTGLFNRRHFMERLEMEIQSSKRYNYPLSLCICDLDYFKAVNDTHGHRKGDMVLSRFGRLLNNILRTENISCRYGGDEFCIIFPHSLAEHAAVSLNRIRKHFKKIVFEGEYGKNFSISATFGIADIAENTAYQKELIEAADKALYKAKQSGRNCIVICDDIRNLLPYEQEKK